MYGQAFRNGEDMMDDTASTHDINDLCWRQRCLEGELARLQVWARVEPGSIHDEHPTMADETRLVKLSGDLSQAGPRRDLDELGLPIDGSGRVIIQPQVAHGQTAKQYDGTGGQAKSLHQGPHRRVYRLHDYRSGNDAEAR